MAENAETERVDEPEKEQETVNEEALMKGKEEDCVQTLREMGNEDDCIQTLHALRDLKIDQETAKLKIQEPLPVSGAPVSAESSSGQASEEAWRAQMKDVPPEGQLAISLLKRLPALSSVSEDRVIMKEVVELAMKFPHIRRVVGHRWATNQVLNPISVERSSSDAILQTLMAAYVSFVASFGNDECKTLVHECPGTIPFLTACLRTQIVETIKFAASAMSFLSVEDSNKKKMGELGAVTPLVDLLFSVSELDMCLSRVLRAIFNLCMVVENREQAVSEGAIIAFMDKIRRRVCVDQLVKTLEMLSRHEKAIAELEDDGMFILKMVFGLLSEEEGVTEKDKEYCMTIIHTVCGESEAKTRELINGVTNGRETLGRVVSSGTARAKEIASELLLKLDAAS